MALGDCLTKLKFTVTEREAITAAVKAEQERGGKTGKGYKVNRNDASKTTVARLISSLETERRQTMDYAIARYEARIGPASDAAPAQITSDDVTVKRASDFKTSKNYDVILPDGTVTQIFKDPDDDGRWHVRGEPDGMLGSTDRESAVDELIRSYNSSILGSKSEPASPAPDMFDSTPDSTPTSTPTSTGATPDSIPTGSTPEAVNAETERVLRLNTLMAAALDAGKLKVVNSSQRGSLGAGWDSAFADGRMVGAYNKRTKEVVIFADRVDNDSAVSVAYHEMLHFSEGYANSTGSTRFDFLVGEGRTALYRRLDLLRRFGSARERKVLGDAYELFLDSGDSTADQSTRESEWMAYAIQAIVQSKSDSSWLGEARLAVQSVLRKVLGIKVTADNLNMREFGKLAELSIAEAIAPETTAAPAQETTGATDTETETETDTETEAKAAKEAELREAEAKKKAEKAAAKKEAAEKKAAEKAEKAEKAAAKKAEKAAKEAALKEAQAAKKIAEEQQSELERLANIALIDGKKAEAEELRVRILALDKEITAASVAYQALLAPKPSNPSVSPTSDKELSETVTSLAQMGEILEKRMPDSVLSILRKQKKGDVTTIRKMLDAVVLEEPSLAPLANQLIELLGDPDNYVTVIKKVRQTKANFHGKYTFSKSISEIALNDAPGYNGFTYETFLHEVAHSVIGSRYVSLNSYSRAALAQFNKVESLESADAIEQFQNLWVEFKEAFPRVAGEPTGVGQARGDIDEFFTWTLTDPTFRKYLEESNYRGTTLLQRFKDWVKNYLFKGADTNTATWLDAALMGANDLIDAMKQDAPDFKFAKNAMYNTANFNEMQSLARAEQLKIDNEAAARQVRLGNIIYEQTARSKKLADLTEREDQLYGEISDLQSDDILASRKALGQSSSVGLMAARWLTKTANPWSSTMRQVPSLLSFRFLPCSPASVTMLKTWDAPALSLRICRLKILPTSAPCALALATPLSVPLQKT